MDTTSNVVRFAHSVAHLSSTTPPKQVEIGLDAGDFWMLPQRVSTAEGASAVVDVWRTTRLHGRFELRPPATELPTRLSVVAETPPGTTGAIIPRGTTFDCTVKSDASWQCLVPAATVDLVLRPKRFTPHYAVNVKLKPDVSTDLGKITLSQGASVVAWLDSRTVKSLKAPARGQLVRMTMGPSPTLGERLSQPVAEGVFNQRGMLQLAPVPPGTYTLEISAPGFAPTRLDDVTVYAASESAIRTAIRLEPPITIRLSFEPPRDPAGAFWRVSVTRADRLTLRRVTVTEGTARSGVLEITGQPPGHYIVSVSDKTQNRYADRELDIQNGADAQRTIDIGLSKASGVVTLAKKPIEADLIFGGRSGAVRVATHADSDGTFDVMLPRRGKWTVDVENRARGVLAAVDAAVDDDKQIEIDLADTEISGRVIGLGGERVGGAVVTLWAATGAVSQPSSSDGTFAFHGIAPGIISVDARDPRSRLGSRSVKLTITDGMHRPDIELALQNSRTIKGNIVCLGQPVIGARVIAYALVAGMTRLQNAVSGLDGGFEVAIPADATQVAIIVAAAGRTLQALTTAASDKPVRIDLAPTGGTLRLRLGGANPLMVFNGTAIPFPEVFQWARAQDPSTTVAEYLNVHNVAPGMYRFCTRRRDKDACQDGFLAPGATLVLGEH